MYTSTNKSKRKRERMILKNTMNREDETREWRRRSEKKPKRSKKKNRKIGKQLETEQRNVRVLLDDLNKKKGKTGIPFHKIARTGNYLRSSGTRVRGKNRFHRRLCAQIAIVKFPWASNHHRLGLSGEETGKGESS